MTAHAPSDLQRIYQQRFEEKLDYRQQVWDILGGYFQRWVPTGGRLLDLGCGYGEFLRAIECAEKYGMDLNPDSATQIPEGSTLLCQDCSARWPLEEGALDVVFTSNFFEHLPSKEALGNTLSEICRTLAPGGRLIAMGPNIALVKGRYWDFWDHYIPLTERSLCEALSNRGLTIEVCHAAFLPYTMVGKRPAPTWMVKLYLKLPFVWRFFGGQFLVVARKG